METGTDPNKIEIECKSGQNLSPNQIFTMLIQQMGTTILYAHGHDQLVVLYKHVMQLSSSNFLYNRPGIPT